MTRQRKAPSPSQDWTGRPTRILKAELIRRGISYQDLSVRLQALGVVHTTANLTNKINRGRFSALFLIQCLEAIECGVLRVRDE